MTQDGTVPKLLFDAGQGADTVAVALENGARAEAVLLRDGSFEDTADGGFRYGGVVVAGAREGDVTLWLRSCRSACRFTVKALQIAKGECDCILTPTNAFDFRFWLMAVDTRNVFNPRSRPSTVSGNEYPFPPLHAPVDAKLTNDGTSVISSSRPPLILSDTSLSMLPSVPAKSPICTI